ncbi:MAG: hypothetical protein JWQ97_3510 [Phenylobacterium sp.]|nr:hypothetical protein [Phenylobacterium sp.]
MTIADAPSMKTTAAPASEVRGEHDIDWQNRKITDEAIALLKADIGLKTMTPAWNHYVTADNIWHFASGVGDDNPMWWDEAYARASPWGGMIAPPTYLISHTSGIRRLPEHGQMSIEKHLPGVGSLWAGERWEWVRPVRVGERVTAQSWLSEVVVNEHSKFGGRSVNQTEQTQLQTDSGEVVANKFSSIIRFDRSAARGASKYADRPLAKWTAQDRAGFSEQYGREPAQRRGARARYIEDTIKGEPLGKLLKGPLTITSLIAWEMAWGSGLAQTDRMLHQLLKLHPAFSMVHPETGAWHTIEAPHFELALAQGGGFPAGYDFGCQRFAWFAHLISDWMGDAGFLTALEFRLRRPNFLGDITWVTGEVVDVDTVAGIATVTVTATNQLGEATATGQGKVRLPTRTAT